MSHPHVLDTPFDNLIPDTTRTRQWRIDPRFLAAVAVAAVVGAALAFGAPRAVEAYQGYQTAKLEAAVAQAAMAPVELPREWRWERKAVTFDHMFRRKG